MRSSTRVMWLLGRLSPDHKTIADFRKDNAKRSARCARSSSSSAARSAYLPWPALRSTGRSSKPSTIGIGTSPRPRWSVGRSRSRRAYRAIQTSSPPYRLWADRQEPSEAITSRVTRLNEKIGKLKEEMARLKALESQMPAASDEQVSLTDPDARSMGEGGLSLQAA